MKEKKEDRVEMAEPEESGEATTPIWLYKRTRNILIGIVFAVPALAVLKVLAEFFSARIRTLE